MVIPFQEAQQRGLNDSSSGSGREIISDMERRKEKDRKEKGEKHKMKPRGKFTAGGNAI